MLGRVRDQARYFAGLARFVRGTISLEEAREQIKRRLANRESSFLSLLQRGVYAHPDNPFRRLLINAGMEFDDVMALVRASGLEAALATLYDRGVYVTYDEVRGRQPIKRDRLEFTVSHQDFYNPLQRRHFAGRSSGSRGAGRRTFVDFGMLTEEAAHVACQLDAHGASGMPIGLWRPLPPDQTALNGIFRYRKSGETPRRWFAQDRFDWSREALKQRFFLGSTLLVSYLMGRPFPAPRYAPRDDGSPVARWMAEMKARGTPAYLDTSSSGATRVALAALELGLDISGSVMRVGGEPLTPGKAAIIARADARVLERYAMTEVNLVAIGCADSVELDDMHVVTDKLAVLQRDKVLSGSGQTVPALVYTTVADKCSQLLINVESGDFATVTERDCGCSIGELGLRTHLSGLGSYDKLTSEGVTFMGSELYRLVEEVLPARFGGYATDYQLVEEEADGLTQVSILAAPKIGDIDEEALAQAVLDGLAEHYRWGPRMAETWSASRTLRVVRREPYAAGNRKILPLYVLRRASGDSDGSGPAGPR